MTTGDAGVPEMAQALTPFTAPLSGGGNLELQPLGGKVLRVDRSGAASSGNQFGRVFDGYQTDDEVNRVVPGNFGWEPNREGNPQPGRHPNDRPQEKFPDAVEALWQSGQQTRAPSGISFVEGAQWTNWDGVLLVSMLEEKELLALKLDADGKMLDWGIALDNEYGRLRSVTQGPDGNLYVTTDNGGDNDVIVKVSPGTT